MRAGKDIYWTIKPLVKLMDLYGNDHFCYSYSMSDKSENNTVQQFEGKKIRTAWNEEKEEWYFSVVDVIGALTESQNPRRYWSDLKIVLKKEGSQLYENIVQLKMRSADGKFYNTDVANTEQLLRLIQSIPSPKAEPFKLWLAMAGKERIDETLDPELAIDRALATYLQKGYSREWINQRLQAIQVRKELTDEWEDRGVKQGAEYAILTDEITRAWAGKSTREYKNFKGLKKENLRDNMSTLEVVLNMLAEATTTTLSKKHKPADFEENRKIAKRGGKVAGNARKEIEADIGEPVITAKNAVDFTKLLDKILEKPEQK